MLPEAGTFLPSLFPAAFTDTSPVLRQQLLHGMMVVGGGTRSLLFTSIVLMPK